MFEKYTLPIKPLSWEGDSNPRLLMYCSSGLGLGHFSRLARIGEAIKRKHPSTQILFLTDLLPQPSQDYNQHFGIIKLPGYIHSTKKSAPAGLKIQHETLQALRVNLISTTLWGFQPHVFLMDTGPHGKKNELAKPLAWLQKYLPKTPRILQFRDIPIPPSEYFDPAIPYREKILQEHHLYDQFIVSGHPNLFNIAQEYEWPKPLEEKLHYCGLVVPTPKPPSGFVLKPEGASTRQKRLLISFGGGWDSDFLTPLMVKTLQELAQKSAPLSLQVDVFTGPSISEQHFRALEALRAEMPISVVRYSQDFPQVLSQADAAFLQAGSTAYQILDSDKPMILYTRDYSTQEQQYRATLLGKFPDVTVINKEWTTNHSLAEVLQTMLEKTKVKRETGLTYNGVEVAADLIINQFP